MKVVCKKKDLEKATAIAQRFAPIKLLTNLPEGILLEAKDSSLLLKSYNLDTGIILKLSAKAEKRGEIVLVARVFSEIAKRSASEDIKIQTNDKMLATISSGQSNFFITGVDPNSYPTIPEIKSTKKLKIKLKTLKKMVRRTIFAIAKANSGVENVYSGVLFEIKNDTLFLVAVDGYRMAVCSCFFKNESNIKFIVPGKALMEISKLVSKTREETVDLILEKNHIIFCLKDMKLIARLVEGNFLDYQSSLPKAHKTKVTVSILTLVSSVERVSLVADDSAKNPLKIILEDNKIKLFCEASLSQASDEIEAKTEGEILEIGLNSKYLLDALKNAGCDEVRLEFSGALSPVKILPIDGDDFVFLVLPVRLKT
ncbi:MAG: DNA polymerase III subunit beta [Oscillospiraceae bacterium]|nr:DNA polymerase III subunit beta [Oscillospiraceae bacterium]